jgi:hypothetical protein
LRGCGGGQSARPAPEKSRAPNLAGNLENISRKAPAICRPKQWFFTMLLIVRSSTRCKV